MLEYSIDTSSIVYAWNEYPRANFPPLWPKMERAIAEGLIVAPRDVLLELERVEPEAYEWAKRQDGFSLELNEAIQEATKAILSQYRELVKDKANRTKADAFVIAVAQVHGCTVVTNEKPTYSLSRPHIPDVCAKMKIRCIDLLGLIKEREWVIGG